MPAGEGITVAIDALEKTMQEMINNSKIINTIDKEISKALGLLLDLVLLPFLPLLAFGIIALYEVILWLGNIWQEKITKILEPKTQSEALDNSLDIVGWLLKMFPGMLAFIEMLNVLKTTLDLLGIKWKWFWEEAKSTALLFADIIIGGIKAVFNPQFWTDLYATILKMWNDFINDPSWAGLKQLVDDWIIKPFNLFKDAIANLPQTIQKAIDFITGFFGFITAGFRTDLDKLASQFKSFVNAIVDTINGFINSLPGGSLIPKIPHLSSGGTIAETGVAVVHKGETVVPAGQGNNTFNFYGLTNDQLPEKVRSILRQEGSRYSA